MTDEPRISEEHLNAFLDGELDKEDRDRVFDAIKEDNCIKADACELRTVREMLQHAYDTPDINTHKTHQHGFMSWGRAVAATVLLSLGGAMGWMGHEQSREGELQAMFWNETSSFQNAALTEATQEQGHQKVVVHLNTGNLAKIEQALDTAEELLRTYAETDQVAEMQIVANSGGLNLLRTGYTPYASRVQELQDRYVNLTFLACQTAMDRLQREQGVDVSKELLPGVEITPSALDEILNRLRDGWVYIKV